MTEHTPGPWELRPIRPDWWRIAPVGKMDGIAEVWTGDGWQEPAEANARLIAAAPELLAACEAAWTAYADGTLGDEAVWDVVHEAMYRAGVDR